MIEASHRHSTTFLATAAAVAIGGVLFGGQVHGPGATLVLGALVLLLGLPHGALDLWVAARQGRYGRHGRFTPVGLLRFHAEYLGLAALTVLSFWAFPVASLLAFLGLSLWHFSEDWRGLPVPVRLACAGVIVLAPTLFHPQAVAGIFAAMTGQTGLTEFVPLARPFVGGLLGATIAAALASDQRAGLEAVTVAGLALALPPLAFFCAYFVLLHAPRHMLRNRAVATGGRGRALLAAYTLAALVLVVAGGVWAGRATGLGLEGGTLRAVFVGLAALTVPHALLIEAEARRKQRTGLDASGPMANAPSCRPITRRTKSA